MLESGYARSALVSDVELIEEHPSSYAAEPSLHHRWIRGDGQVVGWLLGASRVWQWTLSLVAMMFVPTVLQEVAGHFIGEREVVPAPRLDREELVMRDLPSRAWMLLMDEYRVCFHTVRSCSWPC